MADVQPIPVAAVMPIERVTNKNGSGTVVKIIGNTEEAVEMAKVTLNQLGMKGHSVGKTEEVKSSGKSFGVTDWSHCGWNPKGPKPNWVAPENPSKN